MDKIRVENLSITYSTTRVDAIRQLSFTVRTGEFITIIGPSGCGKSTLLDAIAGLVDRDITLIEGRIAIDGKEVLPFRENAEAPRSLNIGYILQQDTLLPWRTAIDNVSVGLEIRGVPRKDRLKKSWQLMQMAGLGGFEDALPQQLSGGMRQRVSLIRTLAYEPEIILMDEPFGALDAQTRLLLQSELLNIWRETRKTIIFVTHDLSEAVCLGERVILMSSRPGTIKRIYEIEMDRSIPVKEIVYSKVFLDLCAAIWEDLGKEVLDLAPKKAEPAP